MLLEMKQINLQSYYPLIHSITSKFPKKYKDELFNECYIQLYNLQNRFEASKGRFETFAYKRLYFTCKDFIQAYDEELTSLDDFSFGDDGEQTRMIDLVEDEFQLEESIINKDYLNQHNLNLTEVEKFIQQKYYEDGISVKNIIRVYQPFHLIKSEQTIRKILKK